MTLSIYYRVPKSCFAPSIYFLFRWLTEIGCNCSNSNLSFYVIQLDACVTYAQIAQLCRSHTEIYIWSSKFTRMRIERNSLSLFLLFLLFLFIYLLHINISLLWLFLLLLALRIAHVKTYKILYRRWYKNIFYLKLF